MRSLQTTALLASAAALAAFAAQAQPKGKVGLYSDVTIEGSILEPEKIEVSDDAELAKLIRAPEGFKVEVYARDLMNPRMLAVSDSGRLYATRRSVGDVVLLEDRDGNIWLGTPAGLQRLSRHRVTPIRNLPIASHIAATSDGSVWLGTTAGLVRFWRDGRREYGVRDGLQGTVVVALHADERGHLWVSTERGVS